VGAPPKPPLAEEALEPEPMSRAALEAAVADAVARAVGRAVGAREPLGAAGLDSIGAVEVRRAVGAAAGLELPATLVFDHPSVAAVAEHVSEQLEERRRRRAAQLAAQRPAFVAAAAAPALALIVPPPPPPTLPEVTERVRALAARLVGAADLEVGAPLMASGLDSLGTEALRKELAAAFGLDLPATAIFDYPSACELAGLITGQLAARHVAAASATAAAAAAAAALAAERALPANQAALAPRPAAAAAAPANPRAPTLTRPGYFTVPSARRLARLTDAQLAAVPRFVVGRAGVGEVAFLYPVDLRGADLDAAVRIERGAIALYPPGARRPPPGGGLDQPALLTYRRIFMRGAPGRRAEAAFRGRLLQACVRLGATFVHWDPAEGVWVAKAEGALAPAAPALEGAAR
jgi:acyl carrier protein